MRAEPFLKFIVEQLTIGPDDGLELSPAALLLIRAQLDASLDSDGLPELVRGLLGLADELELEMGAEAAASALVDVVERPEVLAALRNVRGRAAEAPAKKLLGLKTDLPVERTSGGPGVTSLAFPRRV